MTIHESDEEVNRTGLEIKSNPLIKIMPLALGILAMSWGLMASAIPSMVGRLAAWATIIVGILWIYLTTVRRLVVSDDGVNIELTRKRAYIPYSNLQYVTVRAMHLGGALGVKLVLRNPPRAISGRIALTSDEVLKAAPQLIRALMIHGVDVRVPGRPDVGTG